MNWQKIGFFDVPKGRYPWMASHAQLPTPMPLDDRSVRVFFASRSEAQRSHIGFADLQFNASGDAFTVTDISDEPVLSPGPLGHFDEHGVFPSCIVQHEGRSYLYYIGWCQGVEAPMFYAAIGLAVSDDGRHFAPVSTAPILSRSQFDPCLVTSPNVYLDGDRWRMTYVSGVRWTRSVDSGKLQSHYHIKIAEAPNATDWVRRGEVAIDFGDGETNIARSSVNRAADGTYQMWFSYVHSSIGKYRIGYAISPDGTSWERRDQDAGIGIDDEQCSEMICYPATFRLGGRHYMLYNGNSFGKAGFGVAMMPDRR